MTTPDGIPVLDLFRAERVCANCDRTHCVLTDDVTRVGASLCLVCWLAVLFFHRRRFD